MVGVLFLVALSAGIATVSFSGMRRSAAMDDVIDHIAGCDAQVREAARTEHVPLRLLFDPAAGTIAVGRQNVSADPHVMYTLPDGYRIERLVQARGASFDAAGENISAGGWSSSYALEVSGPNGSRWIRFAGFTGQVTRAKDERDATAILQYLAPAGDDAR